MPAAKKSKRKHHLDRRAADLAVANTGADDDMLTTPEMAEWFGCSVQWFEIGRVKGYGPPFERLAPGLIRYRRGAALRWLRARTVDPEAQPRRRKQKRQRATVTANADENRRAR